MSGCKLKRSLIVLSILALALRVGWICWSHAWVHPNAMEHRSIAWNLANGHGFTFTDWKYTQPTSVQSPPYPFLLAGLFKLFGSDVPDDGSLSGANRAYLVAMLINSVVGAATIPLTYGLARTLGANVSTALLAAGAVVIWPGQVYFVRHVQAVAIITAATVASIILFYRAVRGGGVWPWAGYCVVSAIATLTEPVFLPALFISGILVLLWRNLSLTIRLRNAAILLLIIAAIIGPWSLRNRQVHGKWVPIKSTFWVNVWKGNNEHATGTDRPALSDEARDQAQKDLNKLDDSAVLAADAVRQYDLLTPAERAQLTGQPEVVREKVFKQFATGWISSHPGGYLKLCAVRLVKTLTVDWDNPKSYNVIYIISRYLLLVLTMIGIVVAIRQRWSLLIPAILAGTALATYTLTVTAARFALPFEPLQLCFAAAAVTAIFERRTRATQPRPAQAALS